MQSFPSTDLKQTLGDVLAAAAQSPVAITRHKKPRFVVMSIEEYEGRGFHNSRRSFAISDLTNDQLDLLDAELTHQLDRLPGE
jgi:prevent-host-death family protein